MHLLDSIVLDLELQGCYGGQCSAQTVSHTDDLGLRIRLDQFEVDGEYLVLDRLPGLVETQVDLALLAECNGHLQV